MSGSALIRVLSRPVTENHRLEQRVRRQPVGSMNPAASHLARRIKSADVGTAIEIRHHPAAHIVRGGTTGSIRALYRVHARDSVCRSTEALHHLFRATGSNIEKTKSSPRVFISRSIARATMSLGARSASGW